MYATLEQANAYIESYYSSNNPLRISWNALSDGDKTVQLNIAERTIDQLPLKGKPIHKSKAFPRKPDEEYSLLKAKEATIELAINLLDSEISQRYSMQQQGVKSYKIGDLSETFKDGSSGYSGIDNYAFSIVFPYLSDWLGGGYDICPTRIHRCHGRREHR